MIWSNDQKKNFHRRGRMRNIQVRLYYCIAMFLHFCHSYLLISSFCLSSRVRGQDLGLTCTPPRRPSHRGCWISPCWLRTPPRRGRSCRQARRRASTTSCSRCSSSPSSCRWAWARSSSSSGPATSMRPRRGRD